LIDVKGVKVVLDWIANSAYAMWVNQSAGWPIALTLHAFGTATVVGLSFIIALRLLGLFRPIPFTALRTLIAFVWIGVVCQVVSGLTLWTVKPAQYLADGMFEMKMAFLVVSIVVTAILQKTVKREAAAWETAGAASSRAVKVVAATALLWSAVTIGGRLTAYLGTLYPT
jgi:hypothetical protein